MTKDERRHQSKAPSFEGFGVWANLRLLRAERARSRALIRARHSSFGFEVPRRARAHASSANFGESIHGSSTLCRGACRTSKLEPTSEPAARRHRRRSATFARLGVSRAEVAATFMSDQKA